MAYHNENDASFASFALSASTLGIGAWGIHRYYPRIKYHWFPEGMVEKLQEMKVLDDKYNLPWARRTPMSPIDVIRKKRRGAGGLFRKAKMQNINFFCFLKSKSSLQSPYLYINGRNLYSSLEIIKENFRCI